MAQHDYNLANQTGADFRADLNNALSAIATVNSGASEPSTTFAHQLWVDTSNNVLKIRNAANSAFITTGISITASNTFTGNVTGTVSSLSNHNTDALAEGSSNLYFTTARARASISASGDISYNSSTGVISFTGTSLGVTSVNTLTGTVVLNTNNIGEGSSNLYFTDARARAAISENSAQLSYNSTTGVLTYTQGDTDTVSEGSSNLYYTQARFNSAFSGKSTSDLSEGSNLYYTDARVQAVSINNVVEDTTPQLGGNLDVNGNAIISTSNGAINLDPNGSGVVVFKGNSTKGAGQFKLNCENNSHGITIKGAPHSAGADYTLTLPNNAGTSNQVLTTNGSGVLSWSTPSSGGSTTLLGLTDVGSDGTSGQVLTTDGSGSFTFTTVSGGGSYNDAAVDTHLNTSTASNGEVLSWNGSDYDWVAQSGGGGGGGLSGGTSVYLHNNWSNQTLNLNTVTKLNMDAVDFGNSESAYSTTNKEYTVPSAGQYLFLGNIASDWYTGINAGNQALFLASIYKNGSEVLQQADPWRPAAGPGNVRFQARIMKVLNLAQNDVIDFRVRMAHYGGSASTISIGRGDIYSTASYIYIIKLQ